MIKFFKTLQIGSLHPGMFAEKGRGGGQDLPFSEKTFGYSFSTLFKTNTPKTAFPASWESQ